MDRVAVTKELLELGAPLIPMAGKYPRHKGWTTSNPLADSNALSWIGQGDIYFSPPRKPEEAGMYPCNVGVRTGRTKDYDLAVVVVDFDHKTKEEIWAAYEALQLPKTWLVESGGGGIHAYFRTPPDPIVLHNTQGTQGKRGLGEHIDFRGEGGCATAPGSIHRKTSNFYRWVKGRGPRNLPLADLPTHIIDHLAGSKLMEGYADPGPVNPENFPPVKEGGRHGAAIRLAGALARRKLSEAEIFEQVASWNSKNEPPLEVEEIRGVCHDFWKKERDKDPMTHRKARLVGKDGSLVEAPVMNDSFLGFTDLDHSERMAKLFGHSLRYCVESQIWYIWNKRRMAPDKTGEMMRLARRGAIHARGLLQPDPTRPEEVTKAIKRAVQRLSSLSSMRATLEMLSSEPGIPVNSDDLDRHPLLLGCNNGTIDLRTGHLRRSVIDDLLTKHVKVAYNPKAECPVWEKTLEEIFSHPNGDTDCKTVAYFQRMLGYCLTGDVQEDTFWIWHGTGANGKSLVLETVQSILGEFMVPTPFSTFLSKGEEREKMYQRALFQGARVVYSSEMKSGSPLDEAMVKSLTGRDRVTARHFNGPPFQFDPTHKIILVTNHLPRIKGGDHGIWRRIQLLPFEQCFDAAKGRTPDPELPQKLQAEAQGILAWMVRGTLAWLKQGLNPTRRCLMAAEDYRDSEDVTGGFFTDEAWIVRQPGQRVAYKDLWEVYTMFCEREKVEQVRTQATFKDLIIERGFRKKKLKTGQTVFGMKFGPTAASLLEAGRTGRMFGEEF